MCTLKFSYLNRPWSRDWTAERLKLNSNNFAGQIMRTWLKINTEVLLDDSLNRVLLSDTLFGAISHVTWTQCFQTKPFQ